MIAIQRWQFTVPDDAIDENGHVNNVRFVQWMQDIAVAHATATGGTAAAKAESGAWFARSHRIDYLGQAFAGDEILALTWIVDLRRVRSRRRYLFLRAGDRARLAAAESDWVFVDAASGRPRAIPASVSACFLPRGEDEPGLA